MKVNLIVLSLTCLVALSLSASSASAQTLELSQEKRSSTFYLNAGPELTLGGYRTPGDTTPHHGELGLGAGMFVGEWLAINARVGGLATESTFGGYFSKTSNLHSELGVKIAFDRWVTPVATLGISYDKYDADVGDNLSTSNYHVKETYQEVGLHFGLGLEFCAGPVHFGYTASLGTALWDERRREVLSGNLSAEDPTAVSLSNRLYAGFVL